MSEERRHTMIQRANCYTLLADLYHCRPNEPALERFKAGIASLQTSDEALNRAAGELARALGVAPVAQLLKPLSDDYAKVFLGAGFFTTDAAYPIESVYTTPGRLVMQEAWEAVCTTYADAGFECRPGEELHEDHLAVELDFLAAVAERAARALERDDENGWRDELVLSAVFLRAHPLVWIDDFVADVERCAKSDFIKALAHFTAELLKADLRYLTRELDK